MDFKDNRRLFHGMMFVFIEKISPELKLEESVNGYRCMKESRSFQDVTKHRGKTNMALCRVRRWLTWLWLQWGRKNKTGARSWSIWNQERGLYSIQQKRDQSGSACKLQKPALANFKRGAYWKDIRTNGKAEEWDLETLESKMASKD